jgi:hypothetical protein
MRSLVAVALALVCASAVADPNERAIQRALAGRDQQSSQFNAQLKGQSLDTLNARQLQQLDTSITPRLERSQMTRERDAYLLRQRPVVTSPRLPDGPLPLPGGLPGVGDPIPVQGSGG